MTRDLPLEEIKKHIPQRRLGRPEEVASLVGFLMGEDAATRFENVLRNLEENRARVVQAVMKRVA